MIHHQNATKLPEFDDRREFWRLLQKATPAQRVTWLEWCCEQVSSEFVRTRVITTDGSVGEVWHDAVSLMLGGALSPAAAGEKLVEIVRKG